MQDELVDAPQLELTAAPAAGEDALQLGPTDSPETEANLGDAFSIKHKKPRTEAAPPMKVAKAVTAETNDSVVAALMGLKLPSVKAQPAARAEVRSEPFTKPEDPAPRPALPETFITPDVPVEAEFSDHDAVADVADPIDEQADEAESADFTEAPIENAPPFLRLVFPPLENEEIEQQPAAAPEVAELKEPEPAIEADVPATPLPGPLPEYRERGPQDVPPANPKPRRAIPVAPQWPSEPPQAAPKRRTSPLPAPAEIPTPPVHIVPPVRHAVAPSRSNSATPSVPTEPAGPTGAWWTIPLTFVGIAIVACSILIPASDENRRANYELAKIEQDVDYFERQSAVNKDFIERVNTDATLAERLALRQLHQTRQGVKIAPMSGKPDAFGASPFAMTRLEPPQPLPAYQPVNDVLTDWFLGEERSQQMAAIGLVVAGAGVMLGGRGRSVA